MSIHLCQATQNMPEEAAPSGSLSWWLIGHAFLGQPESPAGLKLELGSAPDQTQGVRSQPLQGNYAEGGGSGNDENGMVLKYI